MGLVDSVDGRFVGRLCAFRAMEERPSDDVPRGTRISDRSENGVPSRRLLIDSNSNEVAPRPSKKSEYIVSRPSSRGAGLPIASGSAPRAFSAPASRTGSNSGFFDSDLRCDPMESCSRGPLVPTRTPLGGISSNTVEGVGGETMVGLVSVVWKL